MSLHKPKISFIAKRSHSRWASALLFLFFVACSVLLPVLSPIPKASAFIDTDKTLSVTDQQDRTQLYALGFCLTANHDSNVFQSGLKDRVTADELNKFDIYVGPQSFWTGAYDVAVGHEINPKDGAIRCKEIDHTAALRFVDITPQDYRNALYKQEGTSTNYTLIDGANKAMDEKLQTLRNAKRNSMVEGGAVGVVEKTRRVSVSLAQCIGSVPEGQVATHDTVKIGGTTYQYLKDRDGGSKISIGHDLQKDGTYKCSELISMAQPDQLDVFGHMPSGITLEILKDNPRALAEVADGKKVDDVVAASSTTPQDDNSCESKGGLLSYVLCPLLRMFDSAINSLDNQINDLLYVPENNLKDDNLVAGAKQVRNLAYFILVPIMLVMVVGTALGFEFVSAYTVKRALPRLVVATIFIALSWPITSFIIGIVNVIGVGISGIILNPFFQNGAAHSGLAEIINGGQAAGAGGVALFAGGVAILALGWALIGILLSYALVAFVVMLFGFLILAIRQVLILVLALLAPLAILAWIFPGNDKLWKLWWGSFTKLLLMYPLIEILISSGKVFSHFTLAAQQGALGILITISAYLLPYFLIPATFKWAGGAFAAVSGMVNNRSKGIFDRQRASRGKIAGDAWKDFQTGTAGGRLNPRRAASMRVGRGLGAGWQGRYGFGARGRAAMATQSNVEPEEIAKENSAFARDVMVDEEVAAAVSLGNNVDKMMQLKHFQGKGRDHAEAVAARGRAVGNSRRIQVAAAKQLAKTGKIVQDAEEGRQIWTSAGGGDAGLTAGLKETMKYTWRGAGRNDIGRTMSGTDANGNPIEISNRTDSLKEMSVSDLSRLKPLGAQGMFGNADEIAYSLSSGQMEPAEREQALRVLYSAETSPYLQPQQQAAVKQALSGLRERGQIDPALHQQLTRETQRIGESQTARDQFNPPQ